MSSAAILEKRLVCKSYTDSNGVQMGKHATLSEKFSEKDFKAGQKFTTVDHGMKRIFMEMNSVYRKQQGGGDEAKK